MNLWERFVANIRLRRFVVLAAIILILWLVRSEMNTILLTFIFTFLVLQLVKFVHRHVHLPSQLIVIVTYVVILGGLYWAITTYLPQLVTSSMRGIEQLYKFYQNPDNDTNEVARWVINYLSTSDIVNQLQNGAKLVLNYVSTIGSFGFTVFMSMILSFFFTIEDKQMAAFSQRFLTSTYGWIF